MVTKISSGSSLYSVLTYNQEKIDKEKARVLFSQRIIEPTDKNNCIGDYNRSFEPYLLANKKTENPILHISINPDPEDVISDEQLSEIAQEYMQGLGYGDQPFLVYKHEDIDRHHLHIVSVKVDETGKMINDSFQHRRSMDVCRKIERKYGLIQADQKRKKESLPLKTVRYEEGEIKQQVANVIRQVMRTYHFHSIMEYKALLSFYNVHVDEVRGKHKDEMFHGLVYSATNNRGVKTGPALKSSLFGKPVGHKALQNRIQKSIEIIKVRRLNGRSKSIISQAMQSCKNRTDFEKNLINNGISVLFRQNISGRIYGVTFIDHMQKVVFNGSRLGKAFSANVFHEKFKNPEQTTGEITPTEQEQSINQNNPTSSVENLSGLIGIENSGENLEEEAFIRRMKRKKRRGFKR
jgi:hypothetical protein